MRAFDTTVALALLFILLVATASADNCLGYCSGVYMCGYSRTGPDYCDCPGAATKSSCPYPCIYTDSGDCDEGSDSNMYSNGNDDDGLSSWAIACIFLVVLAAGVVMYYYVIWPLKNKESSTARRKMAINAPPLDDVKTTTIKPDGTKTAVDVEQALPLDDATETTIQPDETKTSVDVEQAPTLDDVKKTTITPDGTKTVEIHGEGQE